MSKFLGSIEDLDRWFQRQRRILPWRNDPSVYRVWISEIMLQQTQVATVIPYFERFLEKFPSVEALSEGDEADVMRLWAGLGYYSRARNLHKGAKEIAKKGRFPQNRDEWVEIPGVGQYTAGAILSISKNLPEPILDGNVERVLSRVRRVGRQKGDPQFKARLWRLSRIFVETAHSHRVRPSNLNQALMELGALICTPRKPKCLLCPLQQLCRAFEAGEQEAYPPKKKPKQWVRVQEKMHCVLIGNSEEDAWVLLRQRKKGEWREGLWDLLNDSPTHWKRKVQFLGELETQHVVTRHKISRLTQVWRLSRPSNPGLLGAGEPTQGLDFRWVSLANPDVPIGSALKKTLKSLHRVYEKAEE